MSALEVGAGSWPHTIRTERLTLRPMDAGDRDAIIDLVTNPDAYRHLGGGFTREQAEVGVQPPYGEGSGSFVVVETATGDLAGTVRVDRHNPERPGHRDDPDRPLHRLGCVPRQTFMEHGDEQTLLTTALPVHPRQDQP